MTYYIAQKRSYYGPEQKYGWVEDERLITRKWGLSAAMAFDDRQAAEDWITASNQETYHLAHNEASRPEYKILDEDQAYDLEQAWTHDDLGDSRYDWDHCEDPESPTTDEELVAIANANASTWDRLPN